MNYVHRPLVATERSKLTIPTVSVLMRPQPPRSTLFPYTTLFRSRDRRAHDPFRKSFLVDVRHVEHFETAGAVCEVRSEEHTSELQSHSDLVCRLLLEKKKARARSFCLHNVRRLQAVSELTRSTIT